MAQRSKLSSLLMNPLQSVELPTVPTVDQAPTVSPTAEDVNTVDEKQAQLSSPIQKATASTSAQNPNTENANGEKTRRSQLMSLLSESKSSSLLDYGGTDKQQEDTTPIGNNSVVKTAQQYLGVPYVWGGTSPSGFDCSGLMQYAYAQNGKSIPRTSQEQFKSGTAVDMSQLQPGDLVFYAGSKGSATNPGHVVMYVGNGQIIEAPQTGMTVRQIPMSQKGTPVGARRY